jgi:hypothetical protein
MAIVFPASPSNNDTFTVGSITYTYDGSKWIGLGVTPTDRLIEGSNSLEINASNELVWTGGDAKIGGSLEVSANIDLTDSTVDLYSQTTNAASKTFQLFSDIGGTKTEKLSITANGAATLGGVCKVDRTVSGDGCFHAALNGTVTASITSSGSSTFAGTMSIGSGSSAPADYGLIAYSNGNTTSNKSSVYARNIGGGRNFTGDNSAGATTFEVYSTGSVVLTQSAATSINSLDSINSGGGDNVIKVRTQANGGGDPYIKFDGGGSNFVVGEEYNGTTNNKLCLGTGENPSNVTGITINGLGKTVIGSYTLSSEQLRVVGGEADIWLDSSDSGIWRIMGSTGGSTHKFRIYDGTNDRDVFNIDATGNVIKPATPSFRAGRSTNYVPGASTDIVFNTTSITGGHNVGSHYSTSTGKFTAPCDGVYIFAVHVIWQSLNNGQDMDDAFSMYIDSNVAGYSWRRASYSNNITGESAYFTDFGTYQFKLNANQTVAVRNRRGTIEVHGNQLYTTFSGYLLG